MRLKDCSVSKNKESDQQVFLILYISLKEEILACQANLDCEDESYLDRVLEEKVAGGQFSCQDCSKFVGVSELLESTDKLALLKKVCKKHFYFIPFEVIF